LSDLLLYGKHKYNLPELIIFNTYCIGEIIFIVLLFLPFLYLQQILNDRFGWRIEINNYLKFVLVSYFIFARVQLFWKKGEFITILKVLLQVITIYFTYDYLIVKSAQIFWKS
jgi:hypothetical protein